MKIKRTALDRLFSRYIRLRDRLTCQGCGHVYPKLTQGLHTAHIFGRGRYATRWHTRNALALCFACHQHFDTHKMIAVLRDREKRVFVTFPALRQSDEGFTWLVKQHGYTWDELLDLWRESALLAKGLDCLALAAYFRQELRRLGDD